MTRKQLLKPPTKMNKTHGGKRKRAGRKPVSDPKVGVTIYIEKSKIDANGGSDECKEQMFLFLSKRAEKKKKKKNGI
jgi:hypothetical protein